jgi:putative acetyltransferase
VAVAGSTVVGHLLMSPCPVEDAAGATVATVTAIGPVAVHPAVQRQGIGSALMHAAAAVVLARGVPALVLLGHPEYYPRFGFEPAAALGVTAPWDVPPEAWMALRLPEYRPEARGLVTYPPAFDAVT